MASELIFIAAPPSSSPSPARCSGPLLTLTVAESLGKASSWDRWSCSARTYRAPAGGRPRAGRGARPEHAALHGVIALLGSLVSLDGLLHDPRLVRDGGCATGVTASAAEDPGAARGASRHARHVSTLLAHLVDHARRRWCWRRPRWAHWIGRLLHRSHLHRPRLVRARRLRGARGKPCSRGASVGSSSSAARRCSTSHLLPALRVTTLGPLVDGV